MSHADLELCQELPKIRVLRVSPEIKPIQTPEPISEAKSSSFVDDDEHCRTPTSEEHRIPAVLTCPPAPRKPSTARAPGCKRKLSELDFFDAANRDEVENFFRSSFVLDVKPKRNCCPCK